MKYNIGLLMIYHVNLSKNELVSQIYNLISIINEHKRLLGEKPVWLFVATLSCYSIDGKFIIIKLISMVIVLIFFSLVIREKRETPELFNNNKMCLEQCIDEGDLQKNDKDQLKKELNDFFAKKLSIWSTDRSNVKLLLGLSFWIISFFHFFKPLELLFNLIKNI